MGREVRMVPPDWEHPKDKNGHHIPLHKNINGRLAAKCAWWDARKAKWDAGFVEDHARDYEDPEFRAFIAANPDTWVYDLSRAKWQPRSECKYAKGVDSFDKWDGPRPVAESHMPDFEPGTATHLMMYDLRMYENTTEGTPISPAFATPEELARWLADNGASAFGCATADYDAWLAAILRGRPTVAALTSDGFAPLG